MPENSNLPSLSKQFKLAFIRRLKQELDKLPFQLAIAFPTILVGSITYAWLKLKLFGDVSAFSISLFVCLLMLLFLTILFPRTRQAFKSDNV